MTAIIQFREGDRRWVQLEAGRVQINPHGLFIHGVGAEKRQVIAYATSTDSGHWHLTLEREALRPIYRLTTKDAGEPTGWRRIIELPSVGAPFTEVRINP